MKTYLEQFGIELVEIPFKKNGTLDTFILDQKLDDSVTCVLVQSPNFFGVIEDLKQIGESTHKKGALFVTAASEALSTAILQTPAEVDADIAVFEGQSFGVGLNFGGPYLGIFTTKQQYLRSMPGRLVGETVDQRGKRGYVLTFSTREQHIRREKATSNICTNQGLCALMATIYLSLMGKEGLVRLAEINLSLAQYAKSKILENSKIKLMFDSPTFNEFVIDIPKAGGVLFELQKKNIFAGISLMEDYPDLHDGVLVTVTEMNSKEQIDTLVNHINHLVV